MDIHVKISYGQDTVCSILLRGFKSIREQRSASPLADLTGIGPGSTADSTARRHAGRSVPTLSIHYVLVGQLTRVVVAIKPDRFDFAAFPSLDDRLIDLHDVGPI